MYFTIEKTGCAVRTLKDGKGADCHFSQVRIDCFLESTDIGYDKRHIQVPIIPDDGYKGEVDKDNRPVNMDDYKAWTSSLPMKWIDNPFHSHFVQFNSDVKDDEILFVAEIALSWAYARWTTICNEKLEGKETLEIWKTLKNLPLVPIDNNYIKNLHVKRISEIISTDFTKTQDASLYRVGV